MAVDLYKDDLSRVSSADLYGAIEAFTRIREQVENRPQEGFLLDFKQEWDDKALRSVAAFANTLVGILLVGISEQAGRPNEIVGISSKDEVKTKIASSVASNISPTPPYEVAECIFPADAGKRLCVIRVGRGTQLHFLTKKGESPVYVRNEDQSVPADAARLRALIEQRVENPPSEGALANRIFILHSALLVGRARGVGDAAERAKRGREPSPTSLRILLLPLSTHRINLDQVLEKRFRHIVALNYPEVANRALRGVAKTREESARDWYEYQWRQEDLDYERRWRITAAGELGFVTQVRVSITGCGEVWSLCDVAADLIFTLRAVKAFWEAIQYLGEARLIVYLEVPGLTLLHTRENWPYGFGSIFYNEDMALGLTTVSLSAAPGTSALAEADVNFASLTADVGDTVALALNQLLRGLGHTADLQKLREEATHLSNVQTTREGRWGGPTVG